MPFKVCCTCHQTKEATSDSFCRNKSAKDGMSAQCKTCAKQYREEHKEDKKNYPSSSKEYRDTYVEENRDHINELRCVRYAENPEPFRETARRSYAKHRDQRLVDMQEWYQDHKEEMSLYNKEYRETHIDSILLNNRRRKVKLNEFPRIQQEEVDQLLASFGYKCAYCEVDVKRGDNLHLDHKIPLARGGEHTIANLAPACRTCNLKKGTMTDTEFLQRIGGRNVHEDR